MPGKQVTDLRFSHWLEMYMVDRGTTVADVARETGIPRATVTRHRTGQTFPSLEFRKMYASGLQFESLEEFEDAWHWFHPADELYRRANAGESVAAPVARPTPVGKRSVHHRRVVAPSVEQTKTLLLELSTLGISNKEDVGLVQDVAKQFLPNLIFVVKGALAGARPSDPMQTRRFTIGTLYYMLSLYRNEPWAESSAGRLARLSDVESGG